MKFDEWEGFNCGDWQDEVNVRNFIQRNYTPYEGGAEFLAGPTERTKKLWSEVLELYKKEKDSITERKKVTPKKHKKYDCFLCDCTKAKRLAGFCLQAVLV